MSGNAVRLTLLALLLTAVRPATGQETDSSYSLIAYAGGGWTRSFATFDPDPIGLQRNGFAGTLRVMWKPEHLLRVGLETGIQRVYGVEAENIDTEFGPTSGRSTLSAVPILLAISMPVVDHLDAWVGSGFAILSSYVEFFDESTSKSSFTPYFYGGLSYLYPVTTEMNVGGEARYSYMDRFEDNNLTIQLMLSYRVLSW